MRLAAREIYDPVGADKVLRIVQVEILSGPVMRVTFDDGVSREVDFSEAIGRSRWFHTLSVPTTFEDVEVINNGRGLQWVTGADYCTDALRILGDEQLAAKRKPH